MLQCSTEPGPAEEFGSWAVWNHEVNKSHLQELPKVTEQASGL